MNQNTLYRDIAGRCGGDIYIGVVGPVRTGKSTFIKRFMELAVLPNMSDEYRRERTIDELPISGAGRTIMTTQPKFVPDEAVMVNLRENAATKVRLVDCVGYLVPGVLGLDDEDGGARMVRTPWHDQDIPFEEAAQIGTRKVIEDHATIGIVVTTDGSIVDMPRSAYEEAEARVVSELKALGKPFVMVLNAVSPNAAQTGDLAEDLSRRYDVPVVAMNVLNMRQEDIDRVLEALLFEFPLREIRIAAPSWLTGLDDEHWLGSSIMQSISAAAQNMSRVKDEDMLVRALNENEFTDHAQVVATNLNDGTSNVRLEVADGLFYRVLGETCGENIEGEEHLFSLMRELVSAKKEYDRVRDALQSVRTTGYGMVAPSMDELQLQEPQLVKQGSRFGVKLRASAPSLHMIRVDIQTEVSPIVGTEKQSEELVQYLLSAFEGDKQGIWSTQIFGKSLDDLVREGLSTKLSRMPEDVQMKIQESLQKIINEGSGGMICILL